MCRYDNPESCSALFSPQQLNCQEKVTNCMGCLMLISSLTGSDVGLLLDYLLGSSVLNHTSSLKGSVAQRVWCNLEMRRTTLHWRCTYSGIIAVMLPVKWWARPDFVASRLGPRVDNLIGGICLRDQCDSDAEGDDITKPVAEVLVLYLSSAVFRFRALRLKFFDITIQFNRNILKRCLRKRHVMFDCLSPEECFYK